ncbi:uncharacterized protein LOC124434907 [Xenia sp. Carnegie-2017]|uniref:uncharacterized protein LOC124434907 n=1 Tax=Xenia sp. Carnegie-2017 TaxID=2897299 RepID=UPI001F03A3D9|nr:uncharacterized protein LOC124434907 [Xenia sp. Carnegie-2017]
MCSKAIKSLGSKGGKPVCSISITPLNLTEIDKLNQRKQKFIIFYKMLNEVNVDIQKQPKKIPLSFDEVKHLKSKIKDIVKTAIYMTRHMPNNVAGKKKNVKFNLTYNQSRKSAIKLFQCLQIELLYSISFYDSMVKILSKNG